MNSSDNDMSPAMYEYYASNPIVAPGTKWEEVYRFEPGDFALIKGLNVAPNGTIWLVDIGLGRIMSLDMKTKKLVKHIESPGVHAPNGLRFIDDDTLLIADRNRGLCTFTISSGEYKELEMTFDLNNARWGDSIPNEPQGWNILNDLVLAGNNTAYVTDPGLSDCLSASGRVWLVDYSGYKEGRATAQVWARGIMYATGIAISPDGNSLYISEFNTNSIKNIPTYQYVQGMVLDTPYVVAHLVGGHGPTESSPTSMATSFALTCTQKRLPS